jgi:hypothetical protein
MGLFGAGDPPCPAGSICSDQARTFVGKKSKTVGGNRTQIIDSGTGIYHSSATKLNSDGSSTTDVYIIKDNKWQKAATTTDGGKTYTFDDDVAGAGFQNELKNPQGGIHKNVDAGVNQAADNAGVPPTTKNKLLDSTKNNADNDNSESDTKPAAPAAGGGQTEASTEGTRSSFPNLRYPVNIANTKQDIIKFDMHEYVPSKAAASGSSQFGFSRGELGPSIGSVVLPIPSGISDQNKADWGSNSMTALDIAKADIAREAILNGVSKGAEKASDYIDRVRENAGAVSEALGTALAAAAAGVESQALLSRTTGQVLNPNMELLFKGPSLRPFSFKFQLSPRDKEEANQVIKILRFFKQGSAPIRSKSNLFLKSPHIFRIKYVRMGEEGELHRGLNAFKTCALQSVGVNYTPTGNYATYSDGVMVSYDLSMSFSEITPIFNDDYGTGDNDQFIGF